MAQGYNTEGEDQETAGDEEYATVGQIRDMLRRLPAGRPTTPGPTRTPPGRVVDIFRPRVPAGGGGLTESQVRQMVRDELSKRVPYGDVPPRPHPDEAMFPMGLGSVTLTSAGGIAILNAQPQRAFRGERLVLSVFRTAGAIGIPVIIQNFEIGDYKQLVGGSSLPVDVFASDAFGVRLMLDASTPGVLYAVTVQALAAIPVGESIIVAGAVIGRAGEAAAR